jgi:hypothetical protein
MNVRFRILCAISLLLQASTLTAQETKPISPRRITLEEAVQLALKHNHVVRIAGYKVEEKEHAKDVARSAYFPVLRNDSTGFPPEVLARSPELRSLSAPSCSTRAATPSSPAVHLSLSRSPSS